MEQTRSRIAAIYGRGLPGDQQDYDPFGSDKIRPRHPQTTYQLRRRSRADHQARTSYPNHFFQRILRGRVGLIFSQIDNLRATAFKYSRPVEQNSEGYDRVD